MCSHLQGGHGWGDTVGDKHKGRGLHGAACGAGEMQGVCGRRRSVAHAKALHVGAQRSTRDMQGVCRRASCTVRGALHVGARCSTERGFACGTYNGFALTSPTLRKVCTHVHGAAQAGFASWVYNMTQGICTWVHSVARRTRKGFACGCTAQHVGHARGLRMCAWCCTWHVQWVCTPVPCTHGCLHTRAQHKEVCTHIPDSAHGALHASAQCGTHNGFACTHALGAVHRALRVHPWLSTLTRAAAYTHTSPALHTRGATPPLQLHARLAHAPCVLTPHPSPSPSR